MGSHIYTVYITYRNGEEESRTDLNIFHDYEKSCQAADRAIEYNTRVKYVSVKNEQGVTVFFKDRDIQFLETEVVRVHGEEVKRFFSENVNKEQKISLNI